MRLPGGLIEQETRSRDWSFQPVSGALEMALSEVAQAAASTPWAVTRVLSLAPGAARQPAGNRGAGCRPLRGRSPVSHARSWSSIWASRGGGSTPSAAVAAAALIFRCSTPSCRWRKRGRPTPQARVQWQGRQMCFRLPTGEDQERLLTIPPGIGAGLVVLAGAPGGRFAPGMGFRSAPGG